MKEKNIKLFYIHELLFQFSDSMLIIVLPIFIYKLFGSISAVFAFIFLWNVVYSILFIPIFGLAMKLKNPKYFMALGMTFYVAALSIFGNTTTENIRLIIPAVGFYCLYISCYWMVRHWFFSVNSDYLKIGRQISNLAILRMIIGFIAPIIGGALSFLVSFNITFILGAGAGLLSIIPIIFFNAPPHPTSYNYKKVIEILKKPELKAIRPAYFWEGMANNFINNAWILAFAIFIGNVMDLGFLVGVTTLISAILTRLAGNWFDGRKRTRLLTRLTKTKVITSLLYSSIFIFPHVAYAYIIELINKFTISMHQTVVDSYLFAYSNKIHPIHFHLNREVFLCFSRLIGSAILATTFYFLSPEFLWVIIGLGSIMVLGWMSLKNSDHLLN